MIRIQVEHIQQMKRLNSSVDILIYMSNSL